MHKPTIYRVNSDGMVLDYNLALACLWHGSFLNLKLALGF
jgi:hypothetical protein